MSKFFADFKHTARQDIRVFLAPFVGAMNAVKQELNRNEPPRFNAKGKTVPVTGKKL